MVSPPTTIVPLPVVIAEGRILSTAERFTAEVIIDPRVASTVIGEVLCPVEVSVAINLNVPCAVRGEVSLAINRCVIARTVNLRVFRPIDREVSLAIDGNVSCPIHRHISLVVGSNITSRASLLVPRDVLLPNRVHPGFLIDRHV
jgi:hypothetical protein